MEEKLAAYRAKKVKENIIENSWFNRLKRYFRPQHPKVDQNISCLQSTEGKKSNSDAAERLKSSNNHLSKRKVNKETSDNDNENHPRDDRQDGVSGEHQVPSSAGGKWWMMVGLKTLLWLCVWGIFIELEFGAVFFAFSLLVFIYFNTRTGRKDNKPSAYSVFNKDFEQIQGTVTAEQLQQNMFRIPGVSG